jgi:hypothetical protein
MPRANKSRRRSRRRSRSPPRRRSRLYSDTKRKLTTPEEHRSFSFRSSFEADSSKSKRQKGDTFNVYIGGLEVKLNTTELFDCARDAIYEFDVSDRTTITDDIIRGLHKVEQKRRLVEVNKYLKTVKLTELVKTITEDKNAETLTFKTHFRLLVPNDSDMSKVRIQTMETVGLPHMVRLNVDLLTEEKYGGMGLLYYDANYADVTGNVAILKRRYATNPFIQKLWV